MKVEVKEEPQYSENDVLFARHRLKGALQDLIQHSGDDTASSDEDSKNKLRGHKKHALDSRPTRTKRRRTDASTNNVFHHTYVMKLFDRSVDLAQFEEDTPLYPICRAWMANQPRNPALVVKRRLSSPEPDRPGNLNGQDDNIPSEIHELPRPSSDLVNRIPTPLPEQVEKDYNTDFLDSNNDKVPSREELLQMHTDRWVNVRRKWQEQARKYEDRYSSSTAILTAIYTRAQENMA